MPGKPTARPWQAQKSMRRLYLPNEPRVRVCKLKAATDKGADERKPYWPNEAKFGAISRAAKASGGMGHGRSTKDEGRSANYGMEIQAPSASEGPGECGLRNAECGLWIATREAGRRAKCPNVETCKRRKVKMPKCCHGRHPDIRRDATLVLLFDGRQGRRPLPLPDPDVRRGGVSLSWRRAGSSPRLLESRRIIKTGSWVGCSADSSVGPGHIDRVSCRRRSRCRRSHFGIGRRSS